MHPYKVVHESDLITEPRVGRGINLLPTRLLIGQAPDHSWGYQVRTSSGIVSEQYYLKRISISVKGER